MTREWCHYIGTFRDFFDVNRANKQSYLWLRAGGLLELSVDFYGATTRSQKSEHAVASGMSIATQHNSWVQVRATQPAAVRAVNGQVFPLDHDVTITRF